jgi:hypothetical protein
MTAKARAVKGPSFNPDANYKPGRSDSHHNLSSLGGSFSFLCKMP